MKKLITLLLLFSVFFSNYANAAESVTEFPYTENFDETEAGQKLDRCRKVGQQQEAQPSPYLQQWTTPYRLNLGRMLLSQDIHSLETAPTWPSRRCSK